jgi:hypothetical protein
MSVLAFPHVTLDPPDLADVDLRRRVEAVLTHPVLRRVGPVSVAARDGVVRLRGLPDDERLLRAVVAAVLGVPGVRTVVPSQ